MPKVFIEFEAIQLTAKFFRTAQSIRNDESATAKERELAVLIHDAGRVINTLILALMNGEARIVIDDDNFDTDEIAD